MSWFTSMSLNPQKRGAKKLLGNPQAMHAAVMSAFPPGELEKAGGRPLWRVDHRGYEHTLYLVSPIRPDLTHVVEEAGWIGQTWNTADYDPLLSRVTTGQEWGFRLAANPVKSLFEKGRRGKVVPHVTADQQVAWLVEKAPRHGFEIRRGTPENAAEPVDDVLVMERADRRFRRAEPEGCAGTVTIRQAQFEGTLRITDADLMRRALVEGIGRGKAYGCGLLTLKKLG